MKKKKEDCLSCYFTDYLFILMMRFHVGEFYIQERKKKTKKNNPQKSLYFDSLLSKNTPGLYWLPKKTLP